MKSLISASTTLCILLISSSFMIVSPAFAQNSNSLEEKEEISLGYELALKIKFARRLMYENNYSDASAYLENLYQLYPSSPIIINLLKQCYTELEDNFKLENILIKQIEKDPRNLILNLSLSEVIAKQGRIVDALSAFINTSELIDLNDINIMRIFIQSMIRHSLLNQAKEIIDSWRSKTNNSGLLSIEMGTILERKKNYLAAAKEYYSSFNSSSLNKVQAEKKLNLLLDFADSSPIVEKYILEQPDLYRNQNAVDILVSYYLRSKNYEKAFEFAIVKDSIDNYSGNQLISYMVSSSSRKLYNQTIKMAEYFINRNPNIFDNLQIYFLYAEALEKNKKYQDAIGVYRNILDNTENIHSKAGALFYIGKIYLDDFHDYEQAFFYFDTVRSHFPKTKFYQRSLTAIPFCYLGLGDLEKIEKSLEESRKINLDKEEKEKIEYYIAQYYLFRKDYESCRNQLIRLLVEYPKGFYINDALNMMFILDEAENNELVMNYYVDASYYHERNMIDSSLFFFTKIAEDKSHLLGDMALYELAKITYNIKKYDESIQYTDKMLQIYPDSYYIPFVLKIKADILFENENEKDKAIAIYKEIIELYTDYPFIMELREKINNTVIKDPA